MNTTAMTVKHFQTTAPARPARAAGFTLVELLIVISIIGVLAGFIISSLGGVFRNKNISTARAELALIEAAIERYKAAYGIYPPSNPNNVLVNPLYFELEGVANNNGIFTTLDGMNSVASAYLTGPNSSLGVGGILNCGRGGGEDRVAAKVFLPNLKPNQIGSVTNPVGSGNPGVAILVCSVGGPDPSYQPLGGVNLNPVRYNSVNPTHNPNSYDLYIQLVINGKTNLISNWSKQVQINSPLP